MTTPTLTRTPFRLTAEQYSRLTMALDANRVGKNPKGYSHLEAWDVRRWLIRVFGFGSFDIETVALDLVKEIENPGRRKKNKQGEEYGDPYTAWTVVYRAQIRLTIWDQFGGHVVLEDGACGDSTNQPSLGDCHDNAAKTALSQALKRCAVNLGDCFGLGLYNGGGTQSVVNRSLVAPELQAVDEPAAGLPADAPVLPEPGSERHTEELAAAPAQAAATEPPAEPAAAEPKTPSGAAVRDWALKSGRTADEIRTTLARLQSEHPSVAKRKLQNETGDQEELAALLSRLADAAPVDAPPPPAEPAPDAAPMATPEQLQRMHILFQQLGYTDRLQRLDIINSRILHLSTPVDSSKKLTASEATQVINVLQERASQSRADAA